MKKLFYSFVTLSVLVNIVLAVLLVFFIPKIPVPPEVPQLYVGFFEATFNDGDDGLCVAAEDIDLFKQWLFEINKTYY